MLVIDYLLSESATIFLILATLEARAEILENEIRWLVGIFEDTKISLWCLLTSSNVFEWGQIDLKGRSSFKFSCCRSLLRMFHQGCCILYFCHVTVEHFLTVLLSCKDTGSGVGIWSSTFWRTESYQSMIFYLPFAHPDVEHFWIVSIRMLDVFFLLKPCNCLFVLDLPLVHSTQNGVVLSWFLGKFWLNN